MVVVKCPGFEQCGYKTSDEDASVVAVLLNIHLALAHAQATAPSNRGPKLDRPHIDIGVEEEVWNNFVRRWEAFRIGSGINNECASMQLFQCATEPLGDLILKSDPGIHSRPVSEVLKTMRTFAVIPIAIGVIRAELMQLNQGSDEQFRTFAARVKGKAETCGFNTSVTCQCGESVSVNYTQETIRDVLLAGISDLDIRREALSTSNIQQKSVNDIISFVEGREMARNATPSSSISGFSSFKRLNNTANKPDPPKKLTVPPPSERNKSIPCPDCGKQFKAYKERANGSYNSKPHTKCLNCFRSQQQHRYSETNATLSTVTEEDHISQISAITSTLAPLTLDHKIFQKSEWRRQKVSDHPRVKFQIGMMNTTDKVTKSVTIEGIADTGAQSNLWGLREFEMCGFSKSDLRPVVMNVRAANKNPINIIGAFKCQIQGQSPAGKTISCISNIYISDSVSNFYLSYDTMIDLCMIDMSFPTIGGCAQQEKRNPKPRCTDTSVCQVRSLNAGCAKPSPQINESCNCPQRESVPTRPTSLPFPPIKENNERMKEWLLNRFGGSTFNTCPHRPLPCMTGPPIEIHIDESAKPKTCHTAAPIPLHWQEQVQKDLLRDEALGVIEKVPYGEPVNWCHRMVVTRKHNGSPRRTVDLSPLNKFCKRETYAAESPFQLARRIPGNTWKTVTDAWNGYHSVPLRESDRPLTTFITPFGRWRYTRAPQGFLSSGDGYNRRFDAILSEFQRKERCVDDTIFHDDDLEEHWWRTIDFLSTVGAAGIVLNPEKFQFAQHNANFAGFLITENKILPLPKYIDAIKSFPTPTSTTDIRSWFGLINQVANYAQLRDPMELFRPFLSPKYKFFWSDVLEQAFQDSKDIIIKAIQRGVEIFDITQPTCLRPDWSKKGIGYLLLQQHCSCESGMPDCCQEGWKITLAGSRFLSDTEQRYAAIEGEALAIAWGLEQTKYFTQGCPKLLVITDHKPLKKIFGDRTLDEISNTRLFRLKQRTLPWHFRIEHMPGTTNGAADLLSRYPSPTSQVDESTIADVTETMVAASICRDMEDITSISWDLIAQETKKEFEELLNAIVNNSWPNNTLCNEYTRYKDSLYITDGVILYNDRAIIPPSLRKSVLEGLHAAHQGVSSMELRAQSIIFWPGITKDINQIRAKCMDCNKNAPSQAQVPSDPAIPPSTPFEKIFADFFDFGGHHYLITGDRLSGWPEIFSTPTGSSKAGARGLIACLRSSFATFGVPEELSSDGGPEFTASITQDFLAKWGVKHRKSSAYHPQSNGRAEVAVKAAKRLLRSNTSPSGTLDNDKLLRALLQLRNTPDPDCNVSPAQIIYGRPIRDAFSFTNRLEKFTNKAIHPTWREAWSAKENALRARFVKSSEALNEHSKKLKQISIGDRCFIQNQTGNAPNKWERTGTIVETKPHDQYIVKIDGSGRLTTRNRQFLRLFEPASMEVQYAPPPARTQIPNEQKTKPTTVENKVEAQLLNENVPSYLDPPDTQPPEQTYQNATPKMFADNQPPEQTYQNATPKIPAAIQRLQSYNRDGLRECIKAPEEGGRKLRERNPVP